MSATKRRGYRWGEAAEAQPGLFRFSAASFLGAMLLLIVTAPLAEHLRAVALIDAVLLTVVFIAAVMAVGRRPSDLAWAIGLFTCAAAARWLNYLRPDLLSPAIHLTLGLASVVYVVVHLFRFILRARRVTSEVLCAGIATYLTLGLTWAFAYRLIANFDPAAFAFSATGQVEAMQGLTPLFFSYITLTTVGYGDIVPVSGAARMLAMLEAMAGTLYIAILIARLVALHAVHAEEGGEARRL